MARQPGTGHVPLCDSGADGFWVAALGFQVQHMRLGAGLQLHTAGRGRLGLLPNEGRRGRDLLHGCREGDECDVMCGDAMRCGFAAAQLLPSTTSYEVRSKVLPGVRRVFLRAAPWIIPELRQSCSSLQEHQEQKPPRSDKQPRPLTQSVGREARRPLRHHPVCWPPESPQALPPLAPHAAPSCILANDERASNSDQSRQDTRRDDNAAENALIGRAIPK